MLLEFAVSNYKCFTEEVVLKMTPAPKIQDLKYSVLNAKHDNSIRALSSAVIYGPNASGKTNLIGAMETLKNIIRRGHIRNEETIDNHPNVAKNKLELIPNIESKGEPVTFRISFICCKYKIEYLLSIYLGKFLERSVKRRIIEEWLRINDNLIFDRKDTLRISNIDIIKEHQINGFNEKTSLEYSKNNLNEEELFLCSMFKNYYSKTLTDEILNWFDEGLVTVYGADKRMYIPEWDDEAQEREALVDDELNNAIKEFGFTGDVLAYGHVDNIKGTQLMSWLNKKENEVLAVNSNVFESYGTIRFISLFPVIRETLLSGSTLVIDEFDASLHPMVVMSIVNVFHNDEININRAQLIFNTHNPIFLNRNLFRRDEIKFVEKDEDTGVNRVYSLSDFGTSGKGGVRNSENYLHSYFISKYGAIKDIDFSSIFETIVKSKEREKTYEIK